MSTVNVFLFIFLLAFSASALSKDGKLVATSGLLQIEGAGGSGLVPWATLSGYDTQGTDIYIAATKIHLGAIFDYNTVSNLTLRATKANEIGLLGFDSTQQNNYQLMTEADIPHTTQNKIIARLAPMRKDIIYR